MWSLSKKITIAAWWLSTAALLSVGQVARTPESEAAADPGKQGYRVNCGFCHGATARGGAQGGPDLSASSLVRDDRSGRQLLAFLKVGRPEKGMPAFNLPENRLLAIADFLHSIIQPEASAKSSGREALVGDAAAGKAFFNGGGNCKRCHSEQGDLKGVGSKYPPPILQGRIVLPVGDGGYPGFPSSESPRVHATVNLPEGETVSGLVLYVSDYAITVLDSKGERHTIPRHGNDPVIRLEDPLQAHLDLQLLLTDRQMHDLTAYLASLQ